jgi:hypothetical protein
MVSALTTGPKIHGFKLGRCDEFLTAIKIRSTPSFGWEVMPEATCKILRNVKYHLQVRTKILRKAILVIPFARSSCLLPDDSCINCTNTQDTFMQHVHGPSLTFTASLGNKQTLPYLTY